MGIPIIMLRLEGPLQSWGEHSHWDRRDTSDFPTKSAIIGLLSCALGYERNDNRITELSQAVDIAVRCDRPGQLSTDFHTITADRFIMSADGSHKSGGKTIVSYRQYLEDASFFVAVTADDNICKRIDIGMRHPKWAISLGRKSCVPSMPVYCGLTYEYNGLLQVLCCEPVSYRAELPKRLYCEMTDDESSGITYYKNDEITDSSAHIFSVRKVKRLTIIKDGENYVPQ